MLKICWRNRFERDWRTSEATIGILAKGYLMRVFKIKYTLKRRKQNAKDLTQGSYAPHIRPSCRISLAFSNHPLPALRLNFKQLQAIELSFISSTSLNLSKNFLIIINSQLQLWVHLTLIKLSHFLAEILLTFLDITFNIIIKKSLFVYKLKFYIIQRFINP